MVRRHRRALSGHLAGDAFQREQAREDWFIDHSRSTVQLVRPEVVFEPEDVDLVLFECLKRLPGQSFGDFTRIWREHAVHGISMRDHGWLRGYYQLHLLEPGPPSALVAALGTEPVEWDGFVLPYFASIVDIKAMSNSPHNQPGHDHAPHFRPPPGLAGDDNPAARGARSRLLIGRRRPIPRPRG